MVISAVTIGARSNMAVAASQGAIVPQPIRGPLEPLRPVEHSGAVEGQPRVAEGHTRVAEDQPQVVEGHMRVAEDQPQVVEDQPPVTE